MRVRRDVLCIVRRTAHPPATHSIWSRSRPGSLQRPDKATVDRNEPIASNAQERSRMQLDLCPRWPTTISAGAAERSSRTQCERRALGALFDVEFPGQPLFKGATPIDFYYSGHPVECRFCGFVFRKDSHWPRWSTGVRGGGASCLSAQQGSMVARVESMESASSAELLVEFLRRPASRQRFFRTATPAGNWHVLSLQQRTMVR